MYYIEDVYAFNVRLLILSHHFRVDTHDQIHSINIIQMSALLYFVASTTYEYSVKRLNPAYRYSFSPSINENINSYDLCS